MELILDGGRLVDSAHCHILVVRSQSESKANKF